MQRRNTKFLQNPKSFFPEYCPDAHDLFVYRALFTLMMNNFIFYGELWLQCILHTCLRHLGNLLVFVSCAKATLSTAYGSNIVQLLYVIMSRILWFSNAYFVYKTLTLNALPDHSLSAVRPRGGGSGTAVCCASGCSPTPLTAPHRAVPCVGSHIASRWLLFLIL